MTLDIEQARDRIPRRLVRLSALVIVVGIVASIGATLLLGGVSYLGEERRVPKGPRQIEAAQFEVPTEAEQTRAAVAARLRSYGWVDRRAGLVHVPLDVAIRLYLAEAAR